MLLIWYHLSMTDRNPIQKLMLACLAWAVPVGIVVLFSGRFPGIAIPEGVVLAVSVAGFFCLMLGTLSLMPNFSKGSGTLLFVACLAVWGLLLLLDRAGHLPLEIVGLVGTLNLVVASGVAGRGLATGVRRPAELVPVSLVAMAADLASVAAGPTQKIAGILEHYYTGPMTGPPPVVDYVLIKIPVWGAPYFMPLFGVSDLVLLVFLSAGAGKFKINDRLFKIPVAGLGLLVGVFLAHSTSLFIPGMPLMVLFFLPVLLFQSVEARQLTPSDWVYSIVFPAIIIFGVSLSLLP